MKGGFGLTGQSPAAAWMSVWHSPEVCIRISTWPGPGSGTGSSLISSLAPSSGTTAAFMVLMTVSPNFKLLAGYLVTGFPVLDCRQIMSFLCRGPPPPTGQLVPLSKESGGIRRGAFAVVSARLNQPRGTGTVAAERM